MRVRQTRRVATAVSSHRRQSSLGRSWTAISSQPVAISSAITMGASPALKARTERKWRFAWAHRVAL
jgi:hypothetical protein